MTIEQIQPLLSELSDEQIIELFSAEIRSRLSHLYVDSSSGIYDTNSKLVALRVILGSMQQEF